MTGGLYKITCSANGKVYVGSAKNLTDRWKRHVVMLQAGKHFNLHLQNAWSLYGAGSFDYEVITHLGDYNRDLYLAEEDRLIETYRGCGVALFNMKGARGGGQEIRPEAAIRRREIMSELGKRRLGIAPSTVKSVTIHGVTYPSGSAAMRATGLNDRAIHRIRMGVQS